MPILTALPQGITSQPIGSTVVNPIPIVPSPPPVSVPPIAGAVPVAAALATAPPLAVAGAVVGALAIAAVGWAYLDLQDALKNEQAAKDNAARVAARPVNTGMKVTQGIPPFNGGQSDGVRYRVILEYQSHFGGGFWSDLEARNIVGPISAIKWEYGDYAIKVFGGNGVVYRMLGGNIVGSGTVEVKFRNIRITRMDDANDTGGNPAGIGGGDPLDDGYNGDRTREKRPKVPPPQIPNQPPSPYRDASKVALGIGAEVSPKVRTGTPSDAKDNRKSLAPSPVRTPSPTPITPKAPSQAPDKSKEKEKAPFIPPSPDKKIDDIAKDLTGLGAIIALIGANTQPDAQRLNSKNGSCDALQEPSCREGLKNDIVNPLGGKLDAAQLARDGIAANQLLEFKAIATNFTKVKNFLNNTIVDRALGAANFAMNVHNALMLSNALGKTLATVVDTALNFTGFKFYDANTGNATTASRAFNQNVSSIIVNLIGQDQYTELTNEWKVANRIYQSSTSLLNKTERLLGAQSKVAQKGNIDVANIGNALLVNGTVNPNSYPPMAATKEANTPPDLMSDASSPLSSFAGQVRNLNTITKSVNSTLRNVSGIQKDFGKLADLTNSESKVRKSIRSQSASQAKIKAKFTFLQIKQIKVTGKK